MMNGTSKSFFKWLVTTITSSFIIALLLFVASNRFDDQWTSYYIPYNSGITIEEAYLTPLKTDISISGIIKADSQFIDKQIRLTADFFIDGKYVSKANSIVLVEKDDNQKEFFHISVSNSVRANGATGEITWKFRTPRVGVTKEVYEGFYSESNRHVMTSLRDEK